MHRLNLLLSLSLAVNVGLITLLVLHIASTRPDEASDAAASEDNSMAKASANGSALGADDNGVAVAPAIENEYRDLLSTLRATGLPESERRRILRGAAMADWHDDMRKLQDRRAASGEFWKTSPPLGMDFVRYREMVELRREREALLAEILGERVSLNPWGLLEGMGAGLPAEKRDAVMMLEEDYQLLMLEGQKGTGEIVLPEDRETRELLQKERLEDLAAILSPDELEEYELRWEALGERRLDAFAENGAWWIRLLEHEDRLAPPATDQEGEESDE